MEIKVEVVVEQERPIEEDRTAKSIPPLQVFYWPAYRQWVFLDTLGNIIGPEGVLTELMPDHMLENIVFAVDATLKITAPKGFRP